MQHSVNTSALLLAAGNGTRFGGDKLLAPVEPNQLPMGLQSANSIAPHVANLICITRPHDQALIQIFQNEGYTCIPNPDYHTGLASSIVTGLKRIPDQHNLLIVLADMPFISRQNFHEFFHFISQAPDCIARPYFEENPGHPVYFPAAFRDELLQLKGDQGAQAILRTQEIRKFQVDHSQFCKDVDRVSDLA